MFELKHLSAAAIPRALEKAERYRLLNEPWEAESICLDVLSVEPQNQQALVMLILALTDAFAESPGVDAPAAQGILLEMVASLAHWRQRQRGRQIIAAVVLSAVALICLAVLFLLVPPAG